MKVVTLNLLNDIYRKNERLQLAVKQIKDLDPDIVALQEVDMTENVLASLIDGLKGYNYLVHSRTGRLQNKEGLAVFTKYQISQDKLVEFDKQQRIAQLVRIKTSKKSFWLANVHMHWSLLSDAHRQHQVQELINGKHQPSLILGDFNATKSMGSVKMLRQNYNSALHLGQNLFTYPSPLYRPGLRAFIRRSSIRLGGMLNKRTREGWSGMIDYIFFDEKFTLNETGLAFQMPGSDNKLFASDHYGVYADLSLKGS